MPIECAHSHQPVRCPNQFFCVHQPSAVPCGGGVLVGSDCVFVACRWRWYDVLWCDAVWCQVVGCEVRWSNVVRCEGTWGEVMWLVARCHVMSCRVMWCGVMSCRVLPDTWGVQCNASSNRSHPPTSPNIAPAAKKRHWWLILLTHETSSTLCRATGVTLQHHQILHLPRKNDIDDWSFWHMKRPVHCVEQQESPSNITKCCTCREKMALMIDSFDTWNVQYTVSSNRSHPPTSPNIAPATKKWRWYT